MTRSARLANRDNELVACRSQTALQGRFWLQGLDLMGLAIYYVASFGRVASCSTVNRHHYQIIIALEEIHSSAVLSLLCLLFL